MTNSVDHMQRRRQVVLMGAVIVAVVAVWGVASFEWSADLALKIPLLSVTIVGFTLISSKHPSRLVHDLSTPALVVAAIALGRSAPLVVLVSLLIGEYLDAAITKRTMSLVIPTTASLSLIVVFVAAFTPQPGRPIFIALGLVSLAVAGGIAANFGTALLAMNYLHGRQRFRLRDGLRENVPDLLASTTAGAFTWLIPSLGWGLALLLLSLITYVAFMRTRRNEHATALTLELQARILAEEGQGPIPGHTQRVVDMSRGLMLQLVDRRIDETSLEAAAWLHALSFGGLPHRCNGLPRNPILHAYANSLPTVRSHQRFLTGRGFPGRTTDPAVHVIAAACAWDSRLLPSSPIRTYEDVILAFGIEPDIGYALDAI